MAFISRLTSRACAIVSTESTSATECHVAACFSQPGGSTPNFFASQGFSVAQREDLPDKIYKDCHACPRFHCCDEVAMVRGNLPKFAILPEPANWLVKLQGWAPDASNPG